jgi:hypothetical protein
MYSPLQCAHSSRLASCTSLVPMHFRLYERGTFRKLRRHFIALSGSATTMHMTMLYIGTTLAVFLYLSSFRSHLINLRTRHFSVTDFSDPETYENGVSSSGLILALLRVSSKSFSHGYSYRRDCFVYFVQMAHNMCSCNEI